jgi:hypothetical protein
VSPSRTSSPSTPTTGGGGYPVPSGSRVPIAGTCRPGPFNASHSESWLAVKPGTEDLVGTSKFFLVKGNGGQALEPPNNASAKQLGHVEGKQWVAVNHIPGNRFQDHVYAAWAVFNGETIKVRMAVSRDRGQTFDKAVTITPPSQVGPGTTYVYPEIDAVGDVYVSVVAFPPNGGANTIYVARSTGDARAFGAFVPVTTATVPPGEVYPNTRFRSGIVESFAASPPMPAISTSPMRTGIRAPARRT